LLKSLLRAHPELVEPLSGALEPKARAWIAAQRGARKPSPAAEADVPRELVSPPWLAPKPTQGLPILKLEVASPYVPPTWPEDRREAILRHKNPYSWILKQAGIPENVAAGTPQMDGLVETALAKVSGYYRAQVAHLASDAFLLARLDAGTTLSLDADYWFARFGEKFWPKCVEILADNAQEVLSTFSSVPEPRLARAVAFALDKKTQKNAAAAWLVARAEQATLGLIPLAFNDNKHERAAAQKALRVIAGKERTTVERVASQYGPDAAHAVAALLALPADEYPTRLPAAPKFVELESLPPLGLVSGKGDLPLAAVAHLITAIQLSPLEQPLSILADIIEALDPDDAAEFAWAVFSTWLGEGASSKDAWAFWTVGHLGNDDSARRLTPMIRAWPGESAHARAVLGLDVLASIGSDVALMHLHGIAQKLKFKALQERAREKIQAVAEARGLTADELADRLVPDLGLDDSGSLTLDYGPRQFVVGFDQALKPFVRDGAGKLSADPPKPGKSDDRERATAALDQFKLLKKDAKAIAQSQVLRLEMIMCSGRRFDAAAFDNFFVNHPLMIHIVRRVLWGVYDTGKLVSAFRVTEDRSLADASDSAFTLPANATLGVVHRLDLDDASCAAWAQVFGDYEILQPFDQLGRAVFRPTDDERNDKVLRRLSGVTVKTGKILGLDGRGWYRGTPQDGGWVWDMYKPLDDRLRAELALQGGFCVGYMEGTPPQQALGDVVLSGAGSGSDREVTFGALSPGAFSELVRDLEGLRE
jgi:hypothetical protein